MALAAELTAFQQLLEHIRFAWSHWDDDERTMALEDLGKARDAVEVAWLEEIGTTTTSSPEGW